MTPEWLAGIRKAFKELDDLPIGTEMASKSSMLRVKSLQYCRKLIAHIEAQDRTIEQLEEASKPIVKSWDEGYLSLNEVCDLKHHGRLRLQIESLRQAIDNAMGGNNAE